MILKELVTVLGFDIDHKSLKELDESFEALKLGVESLILSVGGAVAGIYEVVHATGEAGEKIKLLSERTGIGVESLQGLQYAAHLANVSSDELTQTLGFLNRSLFAAKHGGGEAMTAFQRLGIGMNQLQNLKADDAFGLIADSMKKISDPTERAALATQIFGRAGQRLIPVLIKGSANLRALNEEAAAFGEFTEEDAENAAEYSESVKRLGAVFDGLKRAVGIGFLQPFKQAADAAREFVLANRAIIKENLDGFIKALTEYLQRAFTVFKAVGHSVWGLVQAFHGTQNAVKIVLNTLGILTGIGLLVSLGKIVMAVYEIAAAFTVANATAAIIPLLIGAGLLAIGLIAEDVYRFFQGDDSVLGRIVDFFKTEFPNLSKFVSGLFDFFIWNVKEVYKEFMALYELVKMVFNYLANSTAVSSFFDSILTPVKLLYGDLIAMFQLVKLVVGYLSGASFAEKLGAKLGGAGDYLHSTFGQKSGEETVPGVGAGAGAGAGATAGSVGEVHSEVNIHVTGGNASPEGIAAAAGRGISQGWNSVLRQTNRIFQSKTTQ